MGVIFTFIVGLFMSFEPITDNDYFWHVVIGKWIDTNHAIPNTPLYSWWGLDAGYKWTSHEWLTEWIMYKLGDIGCIVAMLLIFLALYFIMYKMLKINFKKLFDFKLIWLLLMTVFFKVTGPRPYIISLLFFGYLVYVLLSYVDKEKPIFNKLIWTIPIMQVLWSNLHGGSTSISYVFIIGILCCDLFLKIFKIKEERWASFLLDKKQIKTLLIVLGLTLLATCINPVGYKLLIYPFTNMTDTNMIDYIVEWQSASFHGMLGLYIFIMMAAPIFNMIITKKKFKFHEFALLLLMFFMALKSQRFIGMYGIYSTWLIGKYIFLDDKFYEAVKKPFKRFENIIKYGFILLLILITAFVGYRQINNFKVVDNNGFYSDKAIEKLIELKPKRMYNDFAAGGYLLYKLNKYDALDKVNIWIYGLGDVFSKNILTDSYSIYEVSKAPEEMLKKYNFDLVLTVKRSPLGYYLENNPNWKIVYSDDMCYIFVPNIKQK